MRYHELIDALSDAENPNVLDYIDDAVQMLEDLWGDLKASNARCETLRNMLAKYQYEIVPGYREMAEKAERERNAAICLCGKLIALCSPPKEWVPKLFRRHINRPGDYMGSGYDFLDSFNRIFDNFLETADDEFYTAICGAAEKEIFERKQKMDGKKEE